MTDAAAERPAYDPTTVPIKPAATVMLVRDAEEDEAEGIHVFMLRRTLAAVFGSGMYVFPGGRVETEDGEDPEVAHRLAAIRECFEEAGVLLATGADGEHVVDGHPVLARRQEIYDGTDHLLAVCEQHGLTPSTDELVWVSHWLTPIGEARRFDTRFYLVPTPAGQTSTHDDNETIASLWTRPVDALERQASGELTMMPPTIENLRFLASHGTVAELMEAARRLPPPSLILPKLRKDDEGRLLGVAMPGDADYDALA